MKLNNNVAFAISGFLALSLGATRAHTGESSGSLRIGDKAPTTTIKMKNVDGRELSIADVAGKKGTLVLFSCKHCPWVKAWEDRIVAIGNSYPKKGIGVIVINPNDPASYPEDDFKGMQQQAKEHGYTFPYVMDATSEVARAFGATRTPEAFLFDKDGMLVYHGAIDDNAKDPDKVEAHYLRDALEALIAGKEIAMKETKAIGCSIKLRPQSKS